MVRPDFVKRKLHLILENLGQLTRFKNHSLAALTGDPVKLAAVERLMERVVTRAIDVNEHLIAERSTGREEKTVRLSYKDTFLKLADLKVCPERFAKRIALSAGLRNILVHDYNDVDRRILHRSVKDCLKDYRKYLDYVLRFLRRIGPPPP